jgi:hypothetical protein
MHLNLYTLVFNLWNTTGYDPLKSSYSRIICYACYVPFTPHHPLFCHSNSHICWEVKITKFSPAPWYILPQVQTFCLAPRSQIPLISIKYDVLTALTINITVFRDVTPCGRCRLLMFQWNLPQTSNLIRKQADFSEILVTTNQTTRHKVQ